MSREKEEKLSIVMYHYTRDLKNSRYPQIKGMDYPLFREQIKFFTKNFHIVTMEEVIEATKSTNVVLPENAMLLTFDDGYIDQYLFAYPTLKEYGIQASFFIPGKTFTEHKLLDVNKIHFILASADIHSLMQDVLTELDFYRGREFDYPSNIELLHDYAVEERFDCKEVVFVKRILQTVLPERLRNILSSKLFKKYVGISEDVFAHELYMNREQIKCMKDGGMYIGVHGYDHYWLGNLSEEKMKADIENSLQVMDEFIDRNSWVMNYPYGSYNEKVIEFVKRKGCKCGLATEVGRADLLKDNVFALPRFDCNDFPPKSNKYLTI